MIEEKEAETPLYFFKNVSIMVPMTCGIYSIKNIINNKIYIGSSSNIEKRWRKHLSNLRNNKHPNFHLQSSWDEYGEKYFIFEIVLECPKEELLLQEEVISVKYDVYDNTKGYNISIVPGSPMCNRKHSKDSLEKMRISKLGEKNSFFGKSHTEETKHKLRIQKLGKKLETQHRQKVLKTSFKDGEKNVNSKLTNLQVLEIKESHKTFDSSKQSFYSFCKQIASLYKVHYSTIEKILKNKIRSKND